MGLTVKPRIMTVVMLLCFTAVDALHLETFTATYGPFDSSYSKIFGFEGSATIDNNALILTPNSDYQKGLTPRPTGNLYGRVRLYKQFMLWGQYYNKTSDRVASFNSSFLFSVYPLGGNTSPGEGLAFILVPFWNRALTYSYGQYLGLTGLGMDGSSYNSLLAIEFDNVKQEFDPDANHVGLNINSIRSNVTASLTPLGIELAPEGQARFYNVWVQYDGVHKVIEVYIARQGELEGETPSRPDSPVLKSILDLREVLNQHSYFGFSASTGHNAQLNCILRWNLTVEYYSEDAPEPEDKHPPQKKNILLEVGVGVSLLVIGVAVTGYYHLRKKQSMVPLKSDILRGALKRLPETPREFQFKDLKKATNNFDEKNKLGQGGFGVVYRGHLPKENLEVAVKWFSRETIKGEDDFLAELTIINRLRHKNLVRLLGWCHEEGKLLLVYDYMPNGSLDAHLFTRTPGNRSPSWDCRYNIISGVASALNYLHNECDQRVVHRDLKSSNILLDSYFNARLGDFGLTRTLDKTSYTEAGGVAGTLGYIAPECFLAGKATQQSDVYSFGVVLLEIVCGLRPGTVIDEFDCLINWVRFLHREGRILDAVEERLGDEYVVEEAKKVLVLALACSHPIASERPKTQAIVQIISGLVPVPYVPPFKPALVWPMSSVEEDYISSLVSTSETRSFQTAQLGSGFTAQFISQELFANEKFESV
ncbi:probable L-type lectin-domain containing receptor kinase S.5 [Rhododendron vialii]|uniref:probable L-type lectin-domain containing receptor kinase S.5 n=1 Tax=Rhododendron vialii TaxID=182163 RepID=UPI00265F8C23|nr:probable L-type lectin-domain containing receptor kinase S.5 [Rhododendron vialii]